MRSHGVQVDIVARGTEVAVAAALNQLRLVASAEYVTDEFVAVIEPDGIGALEPSHAGNQIGVGGFQHQVIVIAHEAIGMNLPAGLLAGLQKIVTVDIIQVNVFTPIPAAHDVVHRSRILNAQMARHGSRMPKWPSLSIEMHHAMG